MVVEEPGKVESRKRADGVKKRNKVRRIIKEMRMRRRKETRRGEHK
jgi:hypothetical protein